MNIRNQKGLTTVEFAIIGTTTLLLLFAVIEIGRAMFVLNTLGEITRRSARFATVCPLNDPAIQQVALFNTPGQSTNTFSGLTAANIVIEYLRADGTVIADPAANFTQIALVRSRIVNFQHQMLVPFAEQIFQTPGFATTLRAESLGVPRTGAIVPC